MPKRLTEMLPAHAVADRMQDALNQLRFCLDASPHPVATHHIYDAMPGLERAYRLLMDRAEHEAAQIGRTR